jgi:N-methylhydantoinase A
MTGDPRARPSGWSLKPASRRLGVDIGGTFTDATLIDTEGGAIHTAKVLSTPRDPSEGFLEATRRILRETGVGSGQVRHVVHATTVATNSIIEGKIARTGFITTEGFRDMLEIARQVRPVLYDPLFEKPKPLVPRYLCFEVPERLDAHGRILTPLDEAAVRRVAFALRDEGVESVAVCLLHGYVNPLHERRVGEILRELYPDDAVSLSSEVSPEFREYVRASTTVINAGIRPVVHHYLAGIETQLRAAGVQAELLVMQSNGGVFGARTAGEKPVYMVESGPAAGVIAAAFLGEALGYADVISFDMGGTTAKVGLIQDGAPHVTKDYQVGGTAKAGIGGMAATGYPIRSPVIDLVEIGAGGGSVAWIDSGGMLRVGPQSAGADPGPVCYGRGGTEPTVTDANLVLGRLNPDFFLGGEIALDAESAADAIRRRCAEPLNLDVIAAANAIVEIANAAMINALHLVSVQRGYDPRQFVLTAFGGGGPVHANAMAAEMGIPCTVVPRSPGVFSSLGLLVTDFKREYSVTYLRRADSQPHPSEPDGADSVGPAPRGRPPSPPLHTSDRPRRDDLRTSVPGLPISSILDTSELESTFRELEQQGETELQNEGLPPDHISFLRQIDMRYVGQSHELPVPVDKGPMSDAEVAEMIRRFHDIHDRANGFSAPGEPVELVNVRLTAVGKLARPRLQRQESAGASPSPKTRRAVYFSGEFVDCPIYDRMALGAGATVAGPAIVEEPDSTTVVHPGNRAEVDRFGNLLLSPHDS